jgi:transcriptional regulator with XRE-family HTH domain
MSPNIAVPISLVNPLSDIGSPDNCGVADKSVGVRLRHARKLRGLTQEALAKKAGVSQSSVSELESGLSKSPWGTNLVSLSQSLEVNPEWLASGKGPMDGAAPPLPPEAEKFARRWLRLVPESRRTVEDLVEQLITTSGADGEAVSDERVEETYGQPGRTDRRRS